MRRSGPSTGTACGLAVVVLGALVAAAAELPPEAVTRQLFERLQAARREGGVRPLERLAELDGVALGHARAAAALPPAERLVRRAGALEPELQEAGIARILRVTTHVGLERGHHDPAAALLATWRSNGESWANALDAGNDAIGLAAVPTGDGATMLVSVLLARAPRWNLRALEREAVLAANDVRRRRGVPPLVESAALAEVARAHSEDMARRGFFDHVTPEGEDVKDRLRRRGLGFRALAENLGANLGYDDPVAQAIEAWLDSPGHSRNLLDPVYVATGVGVAQNADGKVIFTQVFWTEP